MQCNRTNGKCRMSPMHCFPHTMFFFFVATTVAKKQEKVEILEQRKQYNIGTIIVLKTVEKACNNILCQPLRL